MTTLWKVLAVLNGLLALLFIILIPLDWGRRHAKEYPVFRRELAIHGLPVDEQDNGWRIDQRPVARDLGPETVNAIFQSAAGGPELGGEGVKTQEDEVKRIQAKVLGKPPAVLRSTLMDLASTWEERDAIARMSDAQVRTELDRRFSAAISPDNDFNHRRQDIAHLLINVSPDRAWHSRVITVVGLVNYARAVDRQAAAFDAMIRGAHHTTDEEYALYQQDYRRLSLRIHELALHVEHLEAALQNEKNLVAKHGVVLNEREKEVKDLTERRDKSQMAAQAALTEQGILEGELFQAQQTIGRILKENLRLEKQVRAMEQGQ